MSSAWGRRPAAPDCRSPASCLERGGYAAVPRTSAFPRFRGSSALARGKKRKHSPGLPLRRREDTWPTRVLLFSSLLFSSLLFSSFSSLLFSSLLWVQVHSGPGPLGSWAHLDTGAQDTLGPGHSWAQSPLGAWPTRAQSPLGPGPTRALAHLGPGPLEPRAHLGPHYRDSPLLPQGLLTPFGFGRGLPSWLALVVAPASASGPPTFPSRGGTSRILRGRRSSSTLWKQAESLAPLGPGLGKPFAIDGIARCFPLGPA